MKEYEYLTIGERDLSVDRCLPDEVANRFKLEEDQNKL